MGVSTFVIVGQYIHSPLKTVIIHSLAVPPLHKEEESGVHHENTQ